MARCLSRPLTSLPVIPFDTERMLGHSRRIKNTSLTKIYWNGNEIAVAFEKSQPDFAKEKSEQLLRVINNPAKPLS